MPSRKTSISLIFYGVLWTATTVYLFRCATDYRVFLGLVSAIATLVCYQISIASSRAMVRIVYAEVVATFALMQLVSIAHAGSNGLYWLDSYYEVRATEVILTNGWSPSMGDFGSVNGYPAVHFLAGQISQLTNTSVLTAARWMGFLAYTTAFVFYLAFARRLFTAPSPVLYSGIALSFMFYFVMVTGFGRMPLSVALFFVILFLLACNLRKPSAKLIATSIVCVLVLVLAHPLSPVVLGVFFTTVLVVMRSRRLRTERMVTPILRIHSLIVLIVTAFYFLYVSLWGQELLRNTVSLLRGLTSAQEIGLGLSTPLHWRLFLYGQGILATILLVFVSKRKWEGIRSINKALGVFSIVVVIWMFISYYLRIEFLRYTIFIWPFMLLSGFDTIREIRLERIAPLIAVSFVLVNVVGFYPYTYDNDLRPSQGEWYQYVSEQELASASALDISGGIVSNHYIRMAFLLEGVSVTSNSSLFALEFGTQSEISYIFLDTRDREWIFTREKTTEWPLFISDQLYSDYQNATTLQRVYDNGQVEIYHVPT